MTDAKPANIIRALALGQCDERRQHARAMNALSLVRDDIADGRTPDRRLINIALARIFRAGRSRGALNSETL